MSEVSSQLSSGLARVVAAALPGVVRVETPTGTASGVVWSEDGVLVTVGGELDEPVMVTFGDESPRPASLVGRDPATHIAVLRMEAAGLVAPEWRHEDEARLGELVLALRRTGRLPRVSLGVLGATGGPWQAPTGFGVRHYLEAEIAQGRLAPGCLVVDSTGAAIGLGAPSLGGANGLVLGPSTLKPVVGAILRYGRVRRSYLGVSPQVVSLPRTLAQAAEQPGGLLLVSVHEGGPAARAGLMLGDVLLGVDHQKVERVSDLMTILGEDRIDQPLEVRLIRAGQITRREVVVGARP